MLSDNIHLTCGAHQGSVVFLLPFIVTVDSLIKRLSYIPWLQRVFFAEDPTIV